MIEPDDGSGWVKVSDGENAGLVPASYVEYEDAAPSGGGGGSEEGSGQYGRCSLRSDRQIRFSFS